MNNVDIGRYSKRIVQYLWDPEPTPGDGNHAEPVWCLGRSYNIEIATTDHRPPTAPSRPTSSDVSAIGSEDAPSVTNSATSSFEEVRKSADPTETDSSIKLIWPEAFLDDFESRIWLSYRSGFPEIAKSQDPKASSAMSFSVRFKSQISSQSGFTSDTGWGCMIRSGQCLLANAIALLRLGRDWRRGTHNTREGEILRLFADDPNAPFSIHRFVQHGAAACGTFPGQWFGPSATAKCIEALANSHEEADLRVYVTGDGPNVFENAVFNQARDGSGKFKPVLLLIGTRLGIDRVTPAYWPSLKACLHMPQVVGIAGGRPSASHYFVGIQDSDFFYLDPHHTRTALPLRSPDNYTIEEVDSCHTRRLRKLPIEDMDPSMLIAFLIRDEDDWADWRQRIQAVEGKAVVHIADTEPPQLGTGGERDGAVDEVQVLDDEDDDEKESKLRDPEPVTAGDS